MPGIFLFLNKGEVADGGDVYPSGVQNAAEQMLAKEGFAVAGFGVAQGSVEGTAVVKFMIPGDGVGITHRAATVGRFIDGEQHVDAAAGVGCKVVPFIRARPRGGQALRGKMATVHDINFGFLDGGMVSEVAADELAVPGPIKFGVCGAVDAHKAASVLDEALHRALLGIVQNVARGVEEDDNGIWGQTVICEQGGIFASVYGEAMRCTQFLNGGNAVVDGIVPEAGCFAENQNVEQGILLCL